MLPVIYSMSVTLDGYIAGPDGDIGWSAPSTERLAFHNEQTRHIAAYVCGRRLYQEMLAWETAEQIFTDPVALEFARIWRPIPKVVFSRTLQTVEGNARLARDDIATELNRLRDQPGDGVVAIGGAGFAANVIALDLVDEYRQFVNPVILGGGTPYFPPLPKPLDLTLAETKSLDSGIIYLRYERRG